MNIGIKKAGEMFSITLVLASVLVVFPALVKADDGYDLGGGGTDFSSTPDYSGGGYDLGGGGTDFSSTPDYSGGGYDLGGGGTGFSSTPDYSGLPVTYYYGQYDITNQYAIDQGGVMYYDNGVGYSYNPGYASMPFYSTPQYYQQPTRVVSPTYATSYAQAPIQQTVTSQPVIQPIQQQQQQATVQPININNVNTNVNTNTNTNTNPSVAMVTPVYQTPVQYPVQYVYPQNYNYQNSYPYLYNNNYQNVSCSIYASPNSISNGQSSFLAWTSYGATTAWLSGGIGNVAPNGTLTVRPGISTSYTLTVSGYNGQTQTCTTYVTVANIAPYVSLTQIPYTGFDFGAVGNAIYWASLLAFAVAASYLVLYYKGGAALFAREIAGVRNSGSARAVPQMTNVRSSGAVGVPAIFSKKEMVKSPISVRDVAPALELPATPSQDGRPVHLSDALRVRTFMQAPKDSMSFVRSKNGNDAPRIVIARQ